MSNLIDCMHLGRDRVIGAYELDGVIVDPGPASCLETLLEGLEGEPRALLLTHIHLDHAGASGSLVRRFPKLRVYVHEVGAPHLVDPAKLLRERRPAVRGRPGAPLGRGASRCRPPTSSPSAGASGSRAFGSPTPRVTRATTSPTSTNRAATPTSATSPACASRRSGLTVAPTPPPDIDLEAWERSLEAVAGWRPQRLCLTHFGPVDDVEQPARAPAGSAARERRARPWRRSRAIPGGGRGRDRRQGGRRGGRAAAPGGPARAAVAGAGALLEKARIAASGRTWLPCTDLEWALTGAQDRPSPCSRPPSHSASRPPSRWAR